MVSVGIIGGGKAAALHAQTVVAHRGCDLVGIHSGPGASTDLAREADVEHLSLDEICQRSDGLIVAVPPSAVSDTVEHVESASGRVRALLIEAPLSLRRQPEISSMVACNLLHAPATREALREVSTMTPHHLQLRVQQPTPRWGWHQNLTQGGPARDPGLRLAPVLLAAAGEPVIDVAVHQTTDAARIDFVLQSERQADLIVNWSAESARIDLEIADEHRVVNVRCEPLPTFEYNGSVVYSPSENPFDALGFFAQLDRFVRCVNGGAAWPAASTSSAIESLLTEAIDRSVGNASP